jgi:HEAT repeat protein
MRTTKRILLAVVIGLAAAPAQAGRGGSPQAIQQAIAANSVDAIQAELERAEYLVCAGCVDLVAPLSDHLDYRVRKVAAWWLARRGSSRPIYVAMLNRLSQPDSTAARNAADFLGELGNPAAVPALAAALSNPTFSGEARAAMARAIGQIGRSGAAAPLTGARGDADPLVKAAALRALRDLGGFHDAGVAAPLLGDPDAEVRAQAAVSVAVLGARSGGSALAQALVSTLAADPSEVVRKKAAWALGEIGAPASVAGAPLQAAASGDASPVVRSLAQAALSKLSQYLSSQ